MKFVTILSHLRYVGCVHAVLKQWFSTHAGAADNSAVMDLARAVEGALQQGDQQRERLQGLLQMQLKLGQ